MAGTRNTRGQAAAAPPAPNTDSDLTPPGSDAASPEPQQNKGPGLKFAQDLTWRAGRPIQVGELIKRLQTLSDELRGLEQDDDDAVKQSFTKVAKALSSEQLLAHKDRGVRAWVASCAVDVLRVCAPDAPFTERELKSVFDMIIKSILPALSDPANPYNSQHMYVLASLANVKSVVLITDLPNADGLMLQLFEGFFDILSGSAKSSTGEQLSKQAMFNMTTVLVVLVEELESLPQDVVDTIIAQFLRVDSRIAASSGSKSKKAAVIEDGQSTLEMKELPPAYTMAKTICNSCADKMAREVSKYFSEVIMEVTSRQRDGKRRESGDAEAAMEDTTIAPSEEDMQELAKAHRLMRELWRACPAVLQNVIPQLEAELLAENVRLRLLATETIGDMVSGIGAAGPPSPPNMDPATYPPPTLSSGTSSAAIVNLLTLPSAPQSFAQTYSDAYQAFLSRENDKSPIIRAARASGVGKVLATSAGGVGLGSSEEKQLAEALSRALNDSDERVRLAAIRSIASFGFSDVVSKLGSTGSVDHPGSVLGNLAERVKDKKPIVREEAMYALAKIWAAATGEIAEGNEEVIELVNGASSKILNAFYTNDQDIMALIDTVLFEVLIPLQYPPIKGKASKANGSQRIKDSQALEDADGDMRAMEPDKIRAERILLLAGGLDERAKRVFLSFSNRQVSMRKYILAYLQACDAFNGGVMDKDEPDIKRRLTQLVENISRFLPDASEAAKDLQKFAKVHDRRSYQLLRFSMAPESDYRTVFNAIKEFRKRTEGSNASASLIDTFMSLIYRSAILLYNKSHIPFFLHYSRTNEKGLANIAHDVLAEVSQRSPEVLKANVSEICHQLQEEAPTATNANSPGAVDSLKACAAFARKFTDEIPQDAKFSRAMTNFALYGSPPNAAKHAVTVIMASSTKKEMLARDLIKQCVEGFEYGKPGYLARLASISRLCLLAPSEVDDHIVKILDIATKEILLKTRNPSKDARDDYEWTAEVDDECVAKCWAIRILVNRIRSHKDPNTLASTSAPVYKLLNQIVDNDGELSKSHNTPASHKPRLRLIAARSLLKLSLSQAHHNLIDPSDFQKLALVAQDAQYQVRVGFLQRLKKYLGQNRLPARFYTIPFLLAFEPEAVFKNETVTWIRSRVSFFAQQKHAADAKDKNAAKVPTTMEAVFPRLIHMLAHHPDYGDDTEDLKEIVRYIVFYITAVATRQNVSLIFHVAQRVKTYTDALEQPAGTPAKSGTPKKRVADSTDYTERLYVLSDLATLTVRAFADAHGWTLQSLPVRVTLPRSLFADIKEHARSLAVAEENYLPDAEALGDEVEKLARAAARKSNVAGAGPSKKRKSEAEGMGGAGGSAGPSAKRARGSFSGTGAAKKEAAALAKKGSSGSGRRRSGVDDEEGDVMDDDVDDDDESGASDGGPATTTKTASKAARSSGGTRRTSGRATSTRSRGQYQETRDSEDDAEMEEAPPAPPAAKSSQRAATPDAKPASKLASPFRRAAKGGGRKKEDETDEPKEKEKEKVLPERKAVKGKATRSRG